MSLRGIAVEVLKLPPFRPLARRLYERFFERQRAGNHYRGIYPSHAEALRHLPRTLMGGYDNQAAAGQYRNRIEQLKVSEYPAMFWLLRLLDQGERSIFDLGGHFGLFYYSMQRFRAVPEGLRWTVCDLPQIIAAGREWAGTNDASRQLDFTIDNNEACGRDVLLVFGALQYFDYDFPEWIAGLAHAPRHILINLTPMHPSRDFHTVQNMGFAAAAYHVVCQPEFVAAMEARGYTVVDRWESFERECHVPFEHAHRVDSYWGFYLRRNDIA